MGLARKNPIINHPIILMRKETMARKNNSQREIIPDDRGGRIKFIERDRPAPEGVITAMVFKWFFSNPRPCMKEHKFRLSKVSSLPTVRQDFMLEGPFDKGAHWLVLRNNCLMKFLRINIGLRL